MSIVHEYRGAGDADAMVRDSNVSIDIGVVNMAITRTSRLAPDNCMRVDHLIIVNLRDADGSEDVDTIGRNLRAVFNASAQEWIWSPPCEILVERQLDQRHEGQHKPPVMHCIYCMLQTMVADRADPMLLFPLESWAAFDAKGIDPTSPQFQQPRLVWMPRSGSQKWGLKGTHGDARKDETLIVAPRVLRQDGDHEAAEWIEALRPPRYHKRTGALLEGSGPRKPMEDACDCVLQSKHRHQEKAEREAIDARKQQRTVTAQAKRDAKEARRVEREEKKRARDDDDGDEAKQPKKRLRRADGSVGASRPLVDLVQLDDDV